MPSRAVVVLILIFWLGVGGWFVVRDLLPRLRSDGSPPYTINVVDEARAFEKGWEVTLRVNDQTMAYRATSQLEYDARLGLFVATTVLLPRGYEIEARPPLYLSRYESTYYLTPEGQFVGGELHLVFRFHVLWGWEDRTWEATVFMEMRDDQLHFRWERKGAEESQGTWPPVPVPSFYHRMLIPLHVRDKIRDLEEGMTWTEPTLLPPYRMDESVPVAEAKARVTVDGDDYLLTYAGPDFEARFRCERGPPYQVKGYELSTPDMTWTYRRP